MEGLLIPDEVGGLCAIALLVWVTEGESETFDFTAPAEHNHPSQHCTCLVLEQQGNFAQKQEFGLAGLLLIRDLEARSCCLFWQEMRWDADIFGSVPLQELWWIPFDALEAVSGTLPNVVHTDLC